VADVNGNGKPDLVVANLRSNSVSVFLGNGDGTFKAAVNYAVGKYPQSVVVADVNGDGRPDLIVTSASGSGSVSVLLGNGDGTFQAAQNFAVGSYPVSVAVADVNGDGRPDLVVANEFSSSVSVLLGNGNGTFKAAQNFAVGSGPDWVAAADVNGDGRADLVVANEFSSSVSVLLGNGNGTFQSAVNFAVGKSPRSVAVADVNGDGRPDLVVANEGSLSNPGNTVSVLLGNGNGTFHSAVNFAVGSNPESVAVADVNGDGLPDLVTANYGSGSVSVLLGNGNGTFQSARYFGAGYAPASVAVADVNGDGRPDLVTANASNSGTVSVLLGNRNAATHLQLSAPASATAGVPFTITLTALTASDQLDALYTGTVHFTSHDGSAVLPADYTFTLADTGSHTFTVTLNTLGGQTLKATDKHTASISGSAVVAVQAPAPAPSSPRRSRRGGSAPAPAATVAEATPFRITATPSAMAGAAVDVLANVVPSYPPTAAFSWLDGPPTLAGNYTFVSADEGAHTSTATAMALLSTGTVHAAGPDGRVRRPFDPDVAVLRPARIEAFFAQDAFTPHDVVTEAHTG
jgi:hypothetical protein